jgi:hypothetical protein
MRLSLPLRGALTLLSLPLLMCCLAGCQTLGVTPTTATIVFESCKAWQALPDASYSAKHDTPETVASVRGVNLKIDALNAARKAWGCKP